MENEETARQFYYGDYGYGGGGGCCERKADIITVAGKIFIFKSETLLAKERRAKQKCRMMI